MTIGSDLYLVLSKKARTNMAIATFHESQIAHGALLTNNHTDLAGPLLGTFEFVNTGVGGNVIKGNVVQFRSLYSGVDKTVSRMLS